MAVPRDIRFRIKSVSGRGTSVVPKSEICPNAKPLDAPFAAVLSGGCTPNEVQAQVADPKPRYALLNQM
jgi:hypothetical protein